MLELDKNGNWWLGGSIIEPWEIMELWTGLVNDAEKMADKLTALRTELDEKDRRLAELVGLLQGAPHGLAAKTEGLDIDQEVINEEIKG